MATIYAPPSEVPVPGFNLDTWQEDHKRFIDALRAWCQQHNAAPETGEIIRFQVADGYAQYMIYSLKPVKLVHIPLGGDAYTFPYINRLTAADVRKEVRREQAIRKLFSRPIDSPSPKGS